MTSFADALIMLGQHMNQHPALPQPSSFSWQIYGLSGYRDGLELVLPSMSPLGHLSAWALTLTDVSSHVQRYAADNALHAHVYGRIAGVEVSVWARVPGEGFPDEPGVHEWDVTVLLQEA